MSDRSHTSDRDAPLRDEVRGLAARLAAAVAGTGSGLAAGFCAVGVVVWLVVGLFRGFSPGWNAVLHSVSAAVALVMLFVIQFASARHSRAVMLKLDELIRIHESARNSVIGVEEAPVAEQDQLEDQMRREVR